MKLTYDPTTKAAYLYTGVGFRGNLESLSVVNDEIIFDRNEDSKLFGIEMLNVDLVILDGERHEQKGE